MLSYVGADIMSHCLAVNVRRFPRPVGSSVMDVGINRATPSTMSIDTQRTPHKLIQHMSQTHT